MSEINKAIAIVTARGANILPSIPCIVISGKNTKMIIPTPNKTGLPTSVADSKMMRSFPVLRS